MKKGKEKVFFLFASGMFFRTWRVSIKGSFFPFSILDPLLATKKTSFHISSTTSNKSPQMSQNDNQNEFAGIETIENALVVANTAFEARPYFIPGPVPTVTGGSTTVPPIGQIGRVALTNPSAIASYTFTLPTTNYDGFSAELYSLGGVTALTVKPSTPAMYLGAVPTAVTAGKSVKFYWNVSLGQWIISQ